MHNSFWQETNGQTLYSADFSVPERHGDATACQDGEYGDGGYSAAERAERQLQNDLKSMADTVQGRRFLKYLLDCSGVFESMPVGNKDMYAYCEGRRSMGLMLYHRLQALDPQYLITIQGGK